MKTIDGIQWFAVEYKLPPEKELVMLTGPNAYVTHTKFLTLGYYDEEYRPSRGGPIRWINTQYDALSDQGWVPTHWAKCIELP